MKKGKTEDGLLYHAGFPNAGEDQRGVVLSLDQLVVQHRASTYFWRLDTAIAELHWPAGALLVVDRALPLKRQSKIVVITEEGFAVAVYDGKQLHRPDGSVYESELEVWGVVSYVLHSA